MIENLQDELYQLENKPTKGAKIWAKISWRVQNSQNRFSKYLKDKNVQNKQYLNYMLMMVKQNIQAILRTFSNLQKKFMKHFTQRRQLSKLLLLNFLAKFITEKNI